MTNHFDRITTESREPFGLPTIRDTGITVSDVVRPIVSGEKSVQDVLDAYPTLELEDVHQALAFAVQDLTEKIGIFNSESKHLLTSVTGYGQVIGSEFYQNYLRDQDQADTSIPDLEHISKIIYHNAASASYYWTTLRDWANLNYSRSYASNASESAIDLQTYLERLQKEIEKLNTTLTVSVTTTDPKLIIRPNFWQQNAMINLCSPIHSWVNEHCLISADWIQETSLVRFMVQYPQKMLSGVLSPVQNALITLKHMNIAVKTEIKDHMVTFTFDLPIADAE